MAKITYAKNSVCGEYFVFGVAGKAGATSASSSMVARNRETPELLALAKVGAEYAPAAKLAKQLNGAKLANGVSARNAPNAAKAISDNKVPAAKAAKPVPAAKAAKARVEAKKTERKAVATAARGNRKYKVLVKAKDVVAREGTWRRAMIMCALNNKDTDGGNACLSGDKQFGKTHKMDWNWLAKNGYIAFA